MTGNKPKPELYNATINIGDGVWINVHKLNDKLYLKALREGLKVLYKQGKIDNARV